VLTLTFLGVGSAFAKRNFQSNALIEAWVEGPHVQAVPDDTLLIDFGTSGPRALHALKEEAGFEYLCRDGRIDYSAIRNVFITHQHSDHFGGLEELAIVNLLQQKTPQNSDARKPRLIGTDRLLSSLWTRSLSGGLGAANGRQAELSDYFRITALRDPDANTAEAHSDASAHSGAIDASRNDASPNASNASGEPADRFCLLDRYAFSPFLTNHLWVDQPFDWPSYGLWMKDVRTGKTVFYSGDTRFDRPRFEPMMARAIHVFHEVQLEPDPQPVHALLGELRSLPDHIRRKMILYHYGDTWDCDSYEFVASEFAGFARPCRRYSLFP